MLDNEIQPKPRRASRKKKTEIPNPAQEAAGISIKTGTAGSEPNTGNIINDILYLLQTTVQSAKENPSVNNINAVVKSLNALKLAASAPGASKGRKSKTMIARRVIAYIEKEILNIG
ncbi:MAG: hypothetical protein HY965_05995 [Ignavibacteriales bacterium]|nr:hypothetical protein [Ignavibacteriales bacterium]